MKRPKKSRKPLWQWRPCKRIRRELHQQESHMDSIGQETRAATEKEKGDENQA